CRTRLKAKCTSSGAGLSGTAPGHSLRGDLAVVRDLCVGYGIDPVSDWTSNGQIASAFRRSFAPHEPRTPCGRGFVEAPPRRQLRGCLEAFISLARSGDYVTHRTDELVKRGLVLGLGRLDQHSAVDDQGEIDGHWMETFVNQRLGHVERRISLGKSFVAEQRLVHARARPGERR